MFSRDQIEQVRAGVDIVEIVREYVPSLKAAGRSVRGLCPFHSERTPSFHVHPEKGIFKCFGCGESGDVISFVAKMEGVGFSDALKQLADRAGVALKMERTEAETQAESVRDKIFRLLDGAARLYEDHLWDERTGLAARQYLQSRGITDETIRTFRLGFAPGTGGGIFETLVKKGASIELCQQAGLVARSNSGRFYDPMFGRVVFPILDAFGHVIAFGGRVLPAAKKTLLGAGEESGGPKYLNSPETPVFTKGKALYGLPQAKTNILEKRRVIVLEGYMDVIGVHQGGVRNAVATLGTAFTRDHARTLKRYASEVTAFFDPDEAGHRAAVRSIEPMLQEDFFPRIVVTSETGDPDEIIAEKGAAFFDDLIAKAPDFVDYLLRATPAGASLAEKSEAAKFLVTLIGQSPNEILKAEWTGRVASALGLRVESVERELIRRTAKMPAASAPAVAVRPKPKAALPSAEEELLQLLIHSPQLLGEPGVAQNDFEVERQRRLFALLVEQWREHGKISIPALSDAFEGADREWLLELTLEDPEFKEPADRHARLLQALAFKRDSRRLQHLSRFIATGAAGDAEKDEYKILLKRVKGSSGSEWQQSARG